MVKRERSACSSQLGSRLMDGQSITPIASWYVCVCVRSTYILGCRGGIPLSSLLEKEKKPVPSLLENIEYILYLFLYRTHKCNITVYQHTDWEYLESSFFFHCERVSAWCARVFTIIRQGIYHSSQYLRVKFLLTSVWNDRIVIPSLSVSLSIQQSVFNSFLLFFSFVCLCMKILYIYFFIMILIRVLIRLGFLSSKRGRPCVCVCAPRRLIIFNE